MSQNIPLVAIVALATAASVAAPFKGHSVALINDPKSHGQVGDGLLSLNEVILLNKRALTEAQLSAAERGQLLGGGADIAFADIDFRVVPKVTFERDLDVIEDTPHGMVVSGSNGLPVLDLAGTRGFVVTSNFADFRDLIMENAAVAVDMSQTDALYGSVIETVTFRNLTGTAIKLTLPKDGGNTRVDLVDVNFESVPTAIEIFDTGKNRTGTLLFDGLNIQGGTQGIAVHLGEGGSLGVTLERSAITGTANAIVFDRPTATNTRQVSLTSLHTTIAGGNLGFSFEGHAAVADDLTLRMADFAGQAQALRLHPLGALHGIVVEDGRLAGGVELSAGSQGKGILLANMRIRNGNLTAGSAGDPVRMTDTIFDSVNVTALGTAAVTIDASRLIAGSVQAQGAATLGIRGCHMAGTSVGSAVTVTGVLPAPQLGWSDAAPLDPKISTAVNLTTDLPPGLAAIWFLGLAETLPYIGPRPIHAYFWLSYMVPLPIVVRGQSQLPVPIPNNLFLVDWDFVAQIVVVPDPGMIAPPLSMPPGRRFVISK